MTFDTVHIVRQYGARRFFSTDQLNPHRKKRLFYGLPPYSAVRCDAFFFWIILRCGAVLIFVLLESYGAVRCGLFDAKSYGAVRCG